MKRLKEANDNLASRTCEVWQPRVGRRLSADEAAELSFAAVGFFSVLAEWAHAELQPPANDIDKVDTSVPAESCHDR
jgi:hypothetical protein